MKRMKQNGDCLFSKSSISEFIVLTEKWIVDLYLVVDIDL